MTGESLRNGLPVALEAGEELTISVKPD
jgi:hypothetical protein